MNFILFNQLPLKELQPSPCTFSTQKLGRDLYPWLLAELGPGLGQCCLLSVMSAFALPGPGWPGPSVLH